jgi:uncharacterized protein (UPF0332 family)
LAHAREGVAEAEVLADAGHWRASVSRLYYACFSAVSALLAQHDLGASKHTGILALFNRHFVKPGTVSRELGRFYNDLFENRQQSDYDDFAKFDAARVRPWLAQAAIFVDRLAASAGQLPRRVAILPPPCHQQQAQRVTRRRFAGSILTKAHHAL